MPKSNQSPKPKRATGRLTTVKDMRPKTKGMSSTGKVMRKADTGQFVIERVPKPDKVELRISPIAKSRLQAAALVTHKSLSAFLLESGLAHADNVLADRTLFVLTDDQWKAFTAALEAPARPRPRLARLLSEPSILE